MLQQISSAYHGARILLRQRQARGSHSLLLFLNVISDEDPQLSLETVFLRTKYERVSFQLRF